MKKLFRALIIAIGMILIPLTVLAAVSDIATMTGNPTDTTIILTWVKPTDANTTVIRYSTSAYPANVTSGTLAYNSTGFQTTVSNLTAGQAYYFAAWGQNGSTYSTNSYNLTVSTLAIALETGALATGNNTVPLPTLNASMTQAPDTTGFNLEPFTSIIAYFNNSSGGLGMPINNAWETIAILGILFGGVMTYVKVRNFFSAFAVVFILTFFGAWLHLVQGWLIGIEIIIATGVWAIDHYLQ